MHDHADGGAAGHHHDHAVVGDLRLGLLLNLGLAAIEFVFAALSQSVAILSEAVHDLADSGSLVAAYVAARISRRPADEKRTFGYRRVSILAALLNGSLLLVMTGWVFIQAIGRFFEPVEVVPGYLLTLAVLTIAVNGTAVVRMARRRRKDLNLEVAFWHLLEDALGGIGLLVGGALIYFTGWTWVDPLIGLVFGLFIIRGALRVVYRSVQIILESAPADVDQAAIERALREHPAVTGVHHMHIWAIDTQQYNMSVHVRIGSRTLPEGLYGELQEIVQPFKIDHLTVQVEAPGEHCLPCGE